MRCSTAGIFEICFAARMRNSRGDLSTYNTKGQIIFYTSQSLAVVRMVLSQSRLHLNGGTLVSCESEKYVVVYKKKISDLATRNASKNVRRRIVPAYLKRLYDMQDRASTFSQISCIFSKGGNEFLPTKNPLYT
jgi:hypothetical protein